MALFLVLACVAAYACPPPPKPTTKDVGKGTESLDPVIYADGIVTEYATDTFLAGSPHPWAHTRQYSSQLTGGAKIQGEGWEAYPYTTFLSPVSGSNNVELYLDHVSKRVFTSSNGTDYTAPKDFLATLTRATVNNKHYFKLQYTQTGEVLYFCDFDSPWLQNQKGILEQATDRYGQIIYYYNYDNSAPGGGRINWATRGDGMWYYYYVQSGPNTGKLASILVCGNGSGRKVKYTYFASGAGYASDCGTEGDLIQVDVLERASSDPAYPSSDAQYSIKRTTMYRYYKTGDADGAPHQLKMVLSPASVQKAMADGNKSEADLLALADTGIVTGQTPLGDYANVKYAYYTSNFNTAQVNHASDGCDGGVGGQDEDLQTKYGGTNVDETGFVRSQAIRKDCKGNLGTRTFFYLGHSTATNLNTVTRIVVEDRTTDAANHVGTRTIHGVNSDRQVLREVFVDNPKAGSPKYWCTSYVRGEDGTCAKNQVTEKRLPSVHTCVNSDTKVQGFLDVADADAGWTTDFMNAADGVVYLYGYDGLGHLVTEKIKQGKTNTALWLAKRDYGSGTSNPPEYLPVHEYRYPVAGTAESPATLQTGLYTYDFYDGNCQQLRTRTVTSPTVGTTENGSNVAATRSEYYDIKGRLRWTQDGEKHVNYYAYNSWGLLAYTMVDVKTDALPGDITNGSLYKWESWSGAAPFSYTGADALQLVTKHEFDGDGRLVKTQDAEGMITCKAYRSNMTRVYAGWNLTAHTVALPIQVEKTNSDGLTLERCAVDPTGLTLSFDATTSFPTGSDGDTQSNYVTWTRYGYNTTTALLESVDRYHNVPASGTGTLSTDYSRTFYRYDTRGRKVREIEVVSGTSTATGVEQVTRLNYDELDRVTSIDRGVSGAGSDMGADYSTDPADMARVSAVFLDEATPGHATNGSHDTLAVGDGVVTSLCSYYGDSGGVDDASAVKTLFHHNWRGQLRGVEPAAGPFSVQDVDNLGRVQAVAEYTSTSNFGDGWATVLARSYYARGYSDEAGTQAFTDANRRSLSVTARDEMGRVYHTETYAVNASGVAGSKVVADTYYNRNSQVVATSSPAKGAAEIAYDGAGQKIEVRAAKALADTLYNATTGAFQYRDPQPTASTGGNDGVLQMTRYKYNGVGEVTDTFTYEADHAVSGGANSDGLCLVQGDVTNADYTRSATFTWFDATHRPTTTAYAGVGDSSATTWTHGTLARPGTEPTASSSTLLVSKNAYAKGRLDQATDPKGLITKYVYDARGRKTQVLENYTTGSPASDQNRSTLWVYDGLSNVVKQIADVNKNGAEDAGTDQVTTYTFYDSTRSKYSARLLTQVQYPDSTDDTVQMAYDLDGRVNTRTLQLLANQTARPAISFVYDSLRRLSEQHVTANGVDTTVQSIKVTYDSLGRRDKVTSYATADCTGTVVNEVQSTYTDFGALEKEYQEHNGAVDGNSLYVKYAFDTTADGNGVFTKGLRLTSVQYPTVYNGETPAERVRSTSSVAPRRVFDLYADPTDASGVGDAISRVTALATDSTRGTNDANVLSAYSFNGIGRLAVEDFGSSTGKPSVRLDYRGQTVGDYTGLDRFGRVQDQLWRQYGGTPADLDRFAYGYDANSNRLWRENNATGVPTDKGEAFAYDGLDRLTGFQRGVFSTGHAIATGGDRKHGEAWDLSATGAWHGYQIDANGDGVYTGDGDLDQTRTPNLANEITAVTESNNNQTQWATPAYDARGNMTTVPKPLDPAATFTCTYDAWNRLAEVRDGGTLVAKYTYDGLNRRTVVQRTSGGTTTYQHLYYNASWQVLETRSTATAGAEPETLQPEYQYVWSLRYVDSPVLRDKNTDANDLCDDERLYFTTDANHNVTALVDTSGAAVERYVYDPYGNVTTYNGTWSAEVAWDDSKKNEVRFAGYRFDPVTGLYDVRNRVYHPYLGWLQRDPLGYVDGMSLYEYCGGGPTGGTDPSGLFFFTGLDPFSDACIGIWNGTLKPCPWNPTQPGEGPGVTDPGWVPANGQGNIQWPGQPQGNAKPDPWPPAAGNRNGNGGAGGGVAGGDRRRSNDEIWRQFVDTGEWQPEMGPQQNYAGLGYGSYVLDPATGKYRQLSYDEATLRMEGRGVESTGDEVTAFTAVYGIGAGIAKSLARPALNVAGELAENAVVSGGKAVAEAETLISKSVPQILKNKAAGDAFRDELAGVLRSAGRDVETEVYKWTPFGKRYIDIEVSSGGKVLGGIETKVGNSVYTAAQRAKDAYLRVVKGYQVNLVRQP
jgi:RHS repeat-associated protein